MHVGTECLQAATKPFGRVHGHISVFEQLGGVQVGIIGADYCQAGAGSHEDDFAVGAKRSLERFHDQVGDEMGVFSGVFDEHRKFVAAEPGDGVTATYAVQQSVCGLDQQRVAGGMAQVVVDELEIVEVHRQHSHRAMVAVIELDCMLEPVVKQDPVGQVGQWITQCTVGRAVEQPPVFGDHQKLAGQHRDHQPGHHGERGIGFQDVAELDEFEATGDGQREVGQPQRKERGDMEEAPKRRR